METTSTMNRLIEEVRDTTLQLRMTPIGEVFSRFPASGARRGPRAGQDIELKISGAESELDKSNGRENRRSADALVRNSMDHGIEAPDKRLAAGKARHGRCR